ncbi:MAG TPA: helix-turn-helix transcriptional regulator [Thermoanaerobaculia bacterium]|jgi:AraC family transcriptional regulator|nr:helix-turn-helix transcriptional regulator [Thermoanaerobaculia bacterium]
MIPICQPSPAHPSRILRAATVPGFHFFRCLHKSAIGEHYHDVATISVLLAGSFEERFVRPRSTETCDRFAVLYRAPGEVHSDRFGKDGCDSVIIGVTAAGWESFEAARPHPQPVVCLREAELAALAHRIVREMDFSDAASSLGLQGLGLELLASLCRSGEAFGTNLVQPRWLLRVRDMLHDRFRDQELELRALAREARVHPASLTRAFRQAYGVTPSEYLRTLRLQWSMQELRVGERSLTEIALEAGFADQSHFSRAFRRQFGTTPGAVRRASPR